MSREGRLYFLDNLRVACMIVVIAHHAGQPYGPTGGAWPIFEATRAAVLGPFFWVNRSFMMSLFFMIAGYFMVMSCDRHGPKAFLRNRLLRLGVPLLVFAAIVVPLQVFVFGASDGTLGSAWPIDVGPLWFVQHLLIYAAAYAGWRMLRPGSAEAPRRTGSVPGEATILGFCVGLALLSGIVRIWYPIDRWVYILGFLRVAWSDVPRDLSLFIIGALAYRRGWITLFPAKRGMRWLGVGVALAALWYVYDLWLAPALQPDSLAIDILILLWESVFCLSICIGLTVLFRERLNVQTRLSSCLARSQYAAYIIHIFIVVGVHMLLAGLAAPPLAKFALATLLSVPATFGIAGLIYKPLRL
jgi:hypothetical protein